MGVKINTNSDSYFIHPTNRSTVRTAGGNIYQVLMAVNAAGTTSFMEVWKSTDGGATWAEKDHANAPSSGGLYDGCTGAIDSTGLIHIVYRNEASMSASIRYVQFNTSTDLFQNDAQITTFTTQAEHGAVGVAIDSNDKPHALWTDSVTNMGTSYRTLYYSNRISGSWATKVEVYGQASLKAIIMGCSMLIDNNNKPQIAFGVLTDAKVRAAIGNANNATSFTLSDCDSATDVQDTPISITMDSSNNTWVSYVRHATNQIVYMVKHNSADAWTTWQTPLTDSRGTVVTGEIPQQAVHAAGSDVYVFYRRLSDNNLVYQKYTGSWGAVNVLNAVSIGAVNTKWAKYSDNGSASQVDVVYTVSVDAFWDKLSLGGAGLTQSTADDINNLADTRGIGYGNLHSDSVNNLADAAKVVLGLPLTLSDNANNLADGTVNVIGVIATAADSLQSLTDALVKLLSYELAFADSEAANWADSHQLLLAHFLALADFYTLTDANVIRMEQRVGFADTLSTLSDAAALQLGTTLTLTDNLFDLTDFIDLQLGQFLQLADPSAQFPTTGILDNFNRSDEGPPPSTNWGVKVLPGESGLAVVGNTCQSPALIGTQSWGTPFGPDCEAYCTIPGATGRQFGVFLRLKDLDTDFDGYLVLLDDSEGFIFVRRYDDGVPTDIALLSGSVSNNMQLGASIVGSLISVYSKPFDEWLLLGTVEDSTYPDAGLIGLYAGSATVVLDDFGGGTIVAPAIISDSLLLGHGLLATDTLTLTDAAVLQGHQSLNFADAITLTDAESHMLELRFNFSDSVDFLSDSESRQLYQLQSFSDSLSPTDELALGYGLLFTDSNSLTDAYAQTLHAVTNAIELELDDALTLSDSLALGYGLIFAEDAVNLADDEVNELAHLISLSDAITLDDAATLIESQLFDFNDSFILVDSESSTLGYNQLFTDALSLTDAESNQLGQLLEFSDAISLNDAQVLLLAHLLTLSDALSLTDSATLLMVHLLNLSDDANFIADFVQTDAPQGPNLQVGITDALTALSDEVALRLGHFLFLADTETITLTDSIAINEGLLTAFSDSFTLSDTTATTLDYSQPLADSFTLSDTVQLRLGYELLLSDTVALDDSIQLQLDYQLVLADSVNTLADSLTLQLDQRLSLNDSFTLTDSLTSTLGHFIPLADSFSLTDASQRQLGHEIALTDNVALTDSLALVESHHLSLSDNAANWADSAAVTVGLTLIITDNGPSFTESISFFSVGRLQFSDSLALIDSLAKSGEGFLQLGDSLTLTDDIDIDLRGPDLELSLTDTLTLTDAISIVISDELRLELTLTDVITLLDHYFDLRHPYTPSAKRHIVVPSHARETRVPAGDRETVPRGSRVTRVP